MTVSPKVLNCQQPKLKVTIKVAKKIVPFKAKTIKKFRAQRRAGGHPLHPRFSGSTEEPRHERKTL